MSSHANPDIVTDGLAFIYDTGSGKSYKGEPTVNVVANPLPTAGWSTANAQGSAITRTYLEEDGKPFMRFSAVTNGSDYPRVTNSVFANSATITGTFSTSLEVRGTAGAVLRFRIYQNGSTKITNSITLTSEWTRYTFDNQTTGFNLNQPYFNPATSNATYDIRNIQVEAKGHSTQFVDGTRSTTQGLLDLTKNETITLSNMSYDSNAQMSFDGTDDQFLISNPGVGTSFSIETVIKVDSYSNGPIFVSPNSVGIDHFFRVNSNGTIRANFVEVPDTANDGYTSTTVINTGEYYHVVISKTPSNGTIYVNGVAEDSHTPTLAAAAWSGDWRIGARWNNTYNLNGEIPILKVYNKALTASEVLQSYNATKDRFIR